MKSRMVDLNNLEFFKKRRYGVFLYSLYTLNLFWWMTMFEVFDNFKSTSKQQLLLYIFLKMFHQKSVNFKYNQKLALRYALNNKKKEKISGKLCIIINTGIEWIYILTRTKITLAQVMWQILLSCITTP